MADIFGHGLDTNALNPLQWGFGLSRRDGLPVQATQHPPYEDAQSQCKPHAQWYPIPTSSALVEQVALGQHDPKDDQDQDAPDIDDDLGYRQKFRPEQHKETRKSKEDYK